MRITGGQLGSRALKAPKGTTTRPTSDRVREALFNILRDDCVGARVLDLYAGTGAPGLEALSRGATFAVFVERSKDALAALHANIASLGVRDRTRVISLPVDRAGTLASAGPFDLVFADPPYADVKSGDAVKSLLAALGGVALSPSPLAPSPRAPSLAEDAQLVLEHAHRDPTPAIDGFRLADTRTYGDTTLAFYSRAGG